MCLYMCAFAGGDLDGDRLQSDSAGHEVRHMHNAVAVSHKTYVGVPVSGPTPAGNCFRVI